MYVQTSKTTIKGKTYTCKTVRESYRTPKGPRSRLVCNISKLPDHVQTAVEVLLKKSGASLVPADSLGLCEALGFGGVAVLHDAWERFGLDRILSGVEGATDRARLKAMIFARLLFPGSKLSLKTLSADSALAASCGLSQDDLDEDRLYQAMDALSGNWVGIEKGLYTEAFPAGVTLVLYDLTSSYFEGAKHKTLAAYGYSRDHRDDRMHLARNGRTPGSPPGTPGTTANQSGTAAPGRHPPEKRAHRHPCESLRSFGQTRSAPAVPRGPSLGIVATNAGAFEAKLSLSRGS